MSATFQSSLDSLGDTLNNWREKKLGDKGPLDDFKQALDFVGTPLSVDLLKDGIKSRLSSVATDAKTQLEQLAKDKINQLAGTDSESSIGDVVGGLATKTAQRLGVKIPTGGEGDLFDTAGGLFDNVGSKIFAAANRGKSLLGSVPKITRAGPTEGELPISLDPAAIRASLGSTLGKLTGKQSQDFTDLVAGRAASADGLPANLVNRALSLRDSLLTKGGTELKEFAPSGNGIDMTFRNRAFEPGDLLTDDQLGTTSMLSRVQGLVRGAGMRGDQTLARIGLPGTRANAQDDPNNLVQYGPKTEEEDFASGLDEIARLPGPTETLMADGQAALSSAREGFVSGAQNILNRLGQGASEMASKAANTAESIGSKLQSEITSNIQTVAKATGTSATEASEALGEGLSKVGGDTAAETAADAAAAAVSEVGPEGSIAGGIIAGLATLATALAPEREAKIPNLSRPFLATGLGGY